MKLYFKQRFFSWFDSYDIYHEDGSVAYTVEGKLSWGHCLHILNPQGEHIATVQQRVPMWMYSWQTSTGPPFMSATSMRSTPRVKGCKRPFKTRKRQRN